MGEKMIYTVEDKYREILEDALELSNTCSILEPADESLTFARSVDYLSRLRNTDKDISVIVPYDMDKQLMNELPKNINVHVLEKGDSIEYVFTYIHNMINKYKAPKENIIGDDVNIHESVIFGVHGNTYCVCPDGSKLNLKHMGNIIVEDYVDIEALSIVHRSGMTSTIIGEGSKVCVKCNVGHNCIIGKRTFLAPGVLLGGGTEIGDNCYLWQGVITRSNIKICSNVVVGAGSLVLGDITEPGTYFGSPAKYVKSYDGSLR
jgi:serine acetyltransferase